MKLFYFLFLMLAVGCSAPHKTTTALPASSMIADGKLFAALFQQRAAEYRALCFQAYNLARLRLDQQLLQQAAKPRAIISDIDETLLDNSAYAVHQSLLGHDWDQRSWYEWTARAEADTVPGAVSFLQYAASKGVQVFYITNRDEQEQASTLQNLQHFHFPDADNIHLVPRQGSSSKEARRQQVMAHFDVVLLLGDNLADFSAWFDRKPEAERNANSTSLSSSFGNKFIVLPNPGYGDWESSFYHYNYSLTAAQKDSLVRASLKGY